MSTRKIARYSLSPLTAADFPTIAEWFEHVEDLALFSRRIPLPVSGDATEVTWSQMIRNTELKSDYWFTIRDDKNEMAGLTGLQQINYIHGDCVLPVFIARSNRQTGLGIRAAGLMFDLAFDQLRLVRVTSYFRSDNDASRSMCKSLGFIEEGCIREGWFARGKSTDMVIVGMLAKEWARQRVSINRNLSTSTVLKMGSSDSGQYRWPYEMRSSPGTSHSSLAGGQQATDSGNS